MESPISGLGPSFGAIDRFLDTSQWFLIELPAAKNRVSDPHWSQTVDPLSVENIMTGL